MTLAVKIALLSSGVFLIVGMIGGILKYLEIMKRSNHRATVYIDIAHRAALSYSFAALVMAELLKFSPYSSKFQLVITGVPLLFFAISIAQYFKLGIQNNVKNQFKERTFSNTWGILLLITGEICGVGAIVWGFILTQIIG